MVHFIVPFVIFVNGHLDCSLCRRNGSIFSTHLYNDNPHIRNIDSFHLINFFFVNMIKN